MKKIWKICAVVLAGIMVITQVTVQAQSAELTRGEFAEMVSEVFVLSGEGAAGFADVAASHPFATGILALQAHGFMNGDGTGNFMPDTYITGAEAAVLLNNMIGFDGALVPQVNLNIPGWALPSASVMLDLTMVDASLIELERLSEDQAFAFIQAAALALAFDGTPYALAQYRLQDNFFAYTNRRFLATAPVRPGNIAAMSFIEVDYLTMHQQTEILEDILTNPNLEVGSNEWMAQELFNMFLDNEARIASISLLDPYFEAIRNASTIDELVQVARAHMYLPIIPFYGISFAGDAPVDATQWAAFVGSTGLTLGSRDLYAPVPELAHLHEAYINMMAEILYIIGETNNLQERAAAVFAIEQARAYMMLPIELQQDMATIFTQVTWEEVLEATSTTGQLTFSGELLDTLLEISVYSPELEYLAFINSLFVEENLQVLSDFAKLHTFSSFLPVLDSDFNSLPNEMFSILLGQPIVDNLTIEQHGLSFVSEMMWRTFSRAYYQRFSSWELKNEVTEMAEEIRSVMREMIADIPWMTPETRELSVEKLDAVQMFIAFPSTPVDELLLTVRPAAEGGNLIEFMTSFTVANADLWIERLQGPANISPWENLPTSTVNAFYSPMLNAIIVPTGILHYPFFCVTSTREQNLGAIGAVIAHEFVHAFDPMGSQFDKYGTMRNWWMEEDIIAFAARNAEVISILDSMEFAGMGLIGALNVGETVTDLGAMEVAMTLARTWEGADLGLVMKG
ncbi:MAG: S-layer homology domain-containing protein, partial [Defluviitaleaceae bacterium]|nr:S-layer homology domain-containing protein [Defluviitaleaceae bacterium]